jgi:hypothetical protein
MFAAKASITRHAAEMRAAAAEAHMSAAKATTAKTGVAAAAKATTVAAAAATAVRLGRSDGQGRGKRRRCQNHDCSFHGTLLSCRSAWSSMQSASASCRRQKLLMTRLVMKGEVGAMRGNPTKFDFRNEAHR